MTLEQCYALTGSDYEDVQGRLLTDKRITRFLRKFAAGSDLQNLEAALEGSDYETAFRAAHNLKGVSANLGLAPLAEAASEMCEALRGGQPAADITPMLAAVTDVYGQVVAAVNELDDPAV